MLRTSEITQHLQLRILALLPTIRGVRRGEDLPSWSFGSLPRHSLLGSRTIQILRGRVLTSASFRTSILASLVNLATLSSARRLRRSSLARWSWQVVPINNWRLLPLLALGLGRLGGGGGRTSLARLARGGSWTLRRRRQVLLVGRRDRCILLFDGRLDRLAALTSMCL